MMKMKRITKIVLPGILLLAVCAWSLPGLKSRTVYGISEGTYRMVTEEDSNFTPYIHFDKGESTRFVFCADPRMSFAYTGTVQLDGKVKACADNGSETWIFEVIDNDTIAFVGRGSSKFMGQTLPDGSLFRYSSD